MAKNVTIQKVLSIILHRIKFIILLTVVMGLGFYIFSRFVISPMYTTSAMIYVQNYNTSSDRNSTTSTQTDEESTGDSDGESKAKTTNEENQKIYPADITASANLAEICVTLFENSDEITALYDGCTVTFESESFFITITVNGTDNQKCANVANELCQQASEIYNTKFSYGQVGTLRQANVPSKPYSPNNMNNMLIGALIGLVVSCVISVLIELVDTTIKSEDDIQNMYGIPVFAEIPDFENQG